MIPLCDINLAHSPHTFGHLLTVERGGWGRAGGREGGGRREGEKEGAVGGEGGQRGKWGGGVCGKS